MFSPPGVDGVLPDEPSAAMQPALPGRAAASLALCGPQCGKRLTTKGPLPRFVTPRRAPVNVKLSAVSAGHIAIPRVLGSFRRVIPPGHSAEEPRWSASFDFALSLRECYLHGCGRFSEAVAFSTFSAITSAAHKKRKRPRQTISLRRRTPRRRSAEGTPRACFPQSAHAWSQRPSDFVGLVARAAARRLATSLATAGARGTTAAAPLPRISPGAPPLPASNTAA